MARPTSVVPCFTAAVDIDIPECAANITTAVVVPVAGLRKGRPVMLWCDDPIGAGLVLSNAHASAKDELTFDVGNLTALPVNPGLLAFSLVQF
jgi:hypothetical protein